MNIQAVGASALYALSQPAPVRPREAPAEAAPEAAQSPANGASFVPTSSPQTSAQEPATSPLPATQADPAQQEAEARKTADNLEKVVSAMGHGLKFSVDKDSGEVVIKIIDPSNDQVIRQIPSEEALRISKAIDTLRGVLIDSSA